MKIETPEGHVILKQPSMDQLKAVAKYLPVAGPLPEKPGGADYGVVMKHGDRETMAVKQQTVDWDAQRQDEAYDTHLSLVVFALKRYLKLGFSGVLMPTVYMRPKKKGRVEVGVAYFGAAGPVETRPARRWSLPHIDAGQGNGFSQMVASFIECMGRASERSGIPLPPIIDLDYRPKSALGSLGFSFLVHGKDLYSLKINPNPVDPTWRLLRLAGIRQAWSMPCVPLEIPAERKGAPHA